MKFSKFLTNADLSEVAHSSGQAKSAVGRRLGSTSSISFEQRKKIENKRRTIRSYGQSKIALRGVSRNSRLVIPQDIAKIEARDYLKGVMNKNNPSGESVAKTNTNTSYEVKFKEPPSRRLSR